MADTHICEQQPREHPVPCHWCHRLTFNVSAVCDHHKATRR